MFYSCMISLPLQIFEKRTKLDEDCYPMGESYGLGYIIVLYIYKRQNEYSYREEKRQDRDGCNAC